MTCPHCGGRNFRWAVRCEHCGCSFDPASSSEPQRAVLPDLTLALPEPAEDAAAQQREAIRAALAERGTRVVITPLLIALNIALFLVLAVQDGRVGSFGAQTLLEWGASYSPDVTHGEWWRLMTAVFLHGGLLHLAMNMLALWMIGPVTERLFGSTAFAVTYTLAGLGGSVVSEWWQPLTVAVGASGAIFGLYGSLLAYLSVRHTTLPRNVVNSLRGGAVVFVIANVAGGFTASYIDNAGHLGGLVSGFLAGLALAATGEASRLIARPARSAIVACAGLAVAIFVVAAVLPRYGDLRRNIVRFSQLDPATLAGAQDLITQVETGQLSEDDCATAIERLLQPWRALRSAFAGLQLPPAEQEEVRRMVRYMAAREKALTLTADAMRKRDVALLAESQMAHAAALADGSIPNQRPVRRGARAPRVTTLTLGSSALNQELRNIQKLDETVTQLYNAHVARLRSGQTSVRELTALIENRIIGPWMKQYETLLALPLHGPAAWAREPVAEEMRRRLETWRKRALAARG